MFTGIVEETGKIITITERETVVGCQLVLEGSKIGDSIAVNGACLTVTKIDGKSFSADVSPETFRVTALSRLKAGSEVNLERALPADGRFGGHVVTGHVDGVAKVISITRANGFYELTIELDGNESRYAVKKGSIAINGISLTIAEISGRILKVAVIPHTYENTNLKSLKAGDYVNIETDIFARYIEKFLSTSDNRSRINTDFLHKNGFC